MKKVPPTFILMAFILLVMFLFIMRMMNNAEKDLKKLEKERIEKGGVNPHERMINSLLR